MKRLLLLIALASLGLAASCPQPPPPPPPCQPVPDAEPATRWWAPNDLELTWIDMPVTVGGGAEECVLKRRLTFDVGQIRNVKSVYSFHGFDNGDSVESDTVLYARDGKPLYKRSEHHEGVVPEYDAFDPPQPVDYDTDGLILDIICRVTAENGQTGDLSARCHLAVYIEFSEGDEPPPPPPGCNIPNAHDPGWKYVATSTRSPKLEPGEPTREFKTRDVFADAKAAIDPTGKPWTQTVAELAAWINEHGVCAAGPWDDELVIRASDGIYEGYKAVATSGGYQGRPERDAWAHDGTQPECGAPDPLGQDAEFVMNHHNQWWDTTFRVCNRAFCDAACDSFIGRRCCPVRCEGDSERPPCEARVVGTQKWWCDGVPITNYCGASAVIVLGAPCLSRTNLAQAKCKTHVKTCTEDGVTCGEGDW